ncbi:MAG: S1C family serine protease, partial [Acidimicrobiia bacterium]
VVGAALAGGDEDFRPAALPPPRPSGGSAGSAGAPVSTPGSLSDVVERVFPTVVGIRSRGRLPGIGQGTGFIVSPDGEIITNHHVVSGSRTILVTLPGEGDARTAEVVASDEDEDVALLRLEGVTNLPAAELGDSESLRVGDEVFAVGHALGLSGGPTVSRGVVSGLQRANGSLRHLIQTDAALNPGNSGGPLFDAAGRVVGVNTMVRGGAENIGFAIAVERVSTVVERLREGRPPPPVAFLGVSTVEPIDGSPGAEILDVSEDTPASGTDLEAGDRIVEVDGEDVIGPAGLADLIGRRSPGDRVDLTFRRGDDERTITVTLGTKPS